MPLAPLNPAFFGGVCSAELADDMLVSDLPLSLRDNSRVYVKDITIKAPTAAAASTAGAGAGAAARGKPSVRGVGRGRSTTSKTDPKVSIAGGPKPRAEGGGVKIITDDDLEEVPFPSSSSPALCPARLGSTECVFACVLCVRRFADPKPTPRLQPPLRPTKRKPLPPPPLPPPPPPPQPRPLRILTQRQ